MQFISLRGLRRGDAARVALVEAGTTPAISADADVPEIGRLMTDYDVLSLPDVDKRSPFIPQFRPFVVCGLPFGDWWLHHARCGCNLWRICQTSEEEEWMEANQPRAREADIAPAPDPTAGRSAGAGWTPADPGPLGLAAFAMTTFLLSMYNADLINAGGTFVVLPIALVYGGIAQILAGMWEFRTGNTFGAVAFTSYGAFWISAYFLLFVVIHSIVAAQFHNAFALYLYAWAIFTTYMFVASIRTTGALALVFLVLTLTFWVLAIGNASLAGTTAATNGTIKLGGWLGLITAALAWYASAAAVINSTFGRVVLPVFPLRR